MVPPVLLKVPFGRSIGLAISARIMKGLQKKYSKLDAPFDENAVSADHLENSSSLLGLGSRASSCSLLSMTVLCQDRCFLASLIMRFSSQSNELPVHPSIFHRCHTRNHTISFFKDVSALNSASCSFIADRDFTDRGMMPADIASVSMRSSYCTCVVYRVSSHDV